MNETTNQEPHGAKPIQILSAWTALEVLSPQPLQGQKGDQHTPLENLEDDDLPWLWDDTAPRGENTSYQVLLGTLDLADTLDRLIETYGDNRPERPPMRGKAIVAVATVDASGFPRAWRRDRHLKLRLGSAACAPTRTTSP